VCTASCVFLSYVGLPCTSGELKTYGKSWALSAELVYLLFCGCENSVCSIHLFCVFFCFLVSIDLVEMLLMLSLTGSLIFKVSDAG